VASAADKPPASVEDAAEAVAAAELVTAEGAPNAWPDESAEAAMLSELRTRGEAAKPAAAVEAIEETDPKNLPPVDSLVGRIPAGIRETLDDLFRARFVRVVRVPKTSLKT
jgi:hypothetical protein